MIKNWEFGIQCYIYDTLIVDSNITIVYGRYRIDNIDAILFAYGVKLFKIGKLQGIDCMIFNFHRFFPLIFHLFVLRFKTIGHASPGHGTIGNNFHEI